MYNTDYYAWTLQQADAMRRRELQSLDWQNLIEEIEGLGKSERRKLESYLVRLLDHLLKLSFWESERLYNKSHWETEVANFRFEIEKTLQENPSLVNLLKTIWDDIYDKRVKVMSRSFDIPNHPKILMTKALDEDWFPNSNLKP